VYATNATDSSAMTVEVSATTPKVPATVTLSNWAQPYNGTPRTVDVTTVPEGLAVDVTYAGNAWAPTNAGSYAVVAIINEPAYEGTTNGTLVVEQVTPTVTTWPTAAPIVEGQTLSNATLSGGSAIESGSFSHAWPTDILPVGTFPVDVVFTPTDALNIATVTGTVSVTVNEAPPPAPTGLSATPGAGRVQLNWVASSNATSYKVKRAAVSGGLYATIGTPSATSYSDQSVINTETYYYGVSAVGAGGEGPDSAVASVTLPNVVPFVEDFEALSTDDLAGQRLWEGSNAVVQAGVGVGGGQGLNLGTGTARQTFANGTNTVTVNVYCKPVPGEEPAAVAPDAAAVFWVDTNLQVRVYSNTTAVTLSAQIDTNAWTHFEVGIDYDAGTWQLRVNDGAVISGLGVYSARTHFSTIRFENTTEKPFFIDDISVASAAAPATDYELWLADYGFTIEDDGSLSSNGVNTIREAYVAGLDPNDPASVFAVTGIGSESGAVIKWGGVPGRLYSVYWSSNLLGGVDSFLLITSNIPWDVHSFTDTVHSAEDTGFYRIDVQLDE